MGRQLDLFGAGNVPLLHFGDSSDVPHVIEPAPPEPVLLEESRSDPAQTDLFGDRWLRAAVAIRALERFDLDEAHAALREAAARYPDDPTLRSRTAQVEALAAALRAAIAKTSTRAEALLSLVDRIPVFLAGSWHLAVAGEIDRVGGAIGEVAASPHWLRGGDISRAEQSARALFEDAGFRSRWGSYLADVLATRSAIVEARELYRDAFATGPREIDLNAIVDVEVRNLVDVANVDYEVPGDAIEWVATVGVLEGIFALPGVVSDPRVAGEWLDATWLARAPRGLQFYRHLVFERQTRDADARVAARRAMKAIDPAMLKRVLAKGG